MFPRLIAFFGLAGLLIAAGGLLLVFLGYARHVGDRKRSENSLRRIGLALFQATEPGAPINPEKQEFFPPATIPQAGKTIDQRPSWFAYIVHSLDKSEVGPESKKATPLASLWSEIDPKRGWKEGGNADLARRTVKPLLATGGKRSLDDEGYAITDYIGSAGLQGEGDDTHRRGIFADEARTPFALVKDGLNETIATLETDRDAGPWLQGGHSTCRRWPATSTGYFSVDGDLGGIHPEGVYVGMAGGSVRFLTNQTAPAVFRSMLTIDGTEEID